MCSRENWLDCLKGIAIILVVLGHVLDGSTGNNLFPNDTWIKSLHTAIYIFHMPLFFCLSGMSLSIMKRKMGGTGTTFTIYFICMLFGLGLDIAANIYLKIM